MTNIDDDDDVAEGLLLFYRRVSTARHLDLAALRAASSQHTEPGLVARGFNVDAELAWVIWLEAQAAEDSEDAARLDAWVQALVPDNDALRRYFEAFPPGAEQTRFRRRRAQVALARPREDRRGGPAHVDAHHYAAASSVDEAAGTAHSEDYRTSVRYIIDEGHLRCFVDIEAQHDIVSEVFQIDIQFKRGGHMRCIFRFPEDSHFGVNAGPMENRRLEDIESYRISRLDEE